MGKIKSYLTTAFGVLISLFIIFLIVDLIAWFFGITVARYILSPLSLIGKGRKTTTAAATTSS